jgi:soluble lytic murein transglycosylase
MRMVMESLDNHPVLASAAYNAGPGRARRWRADRPLEGAIYAETIPFNETRDYVKKVMSNSVYYSALFEGKPQSLKPRLGTIGARSDAPKGEELP